MVFCWTGILPLAIALVILVPSILVAFDITPIPLSAGYEKMYLSVLPLKQNVKIPKPDCYFINLELNKLTTKTF